MTKKIIKYITIISLASTAIANADTIDNHPSFLDGKNYVKIKAGVAKPNAIGGNTNLNSGKTNYVVGVSVGRNVLSFLLIDLEYMHFGKDKAQYTPSSTTQTTWNVQSDVLMANLRLNLLKNFEIMPYIKAGAGISRNKSSAYSTVSAGTSDVYGGRTINSFAWQVGMGLSFEYNETFGTELEYTYVNRGKVKTQGSHVFTRGANSNPPVTDGGKHGTLVDNIVTFGIKFHF